MSQTLAYPVDYLTAACALTIYALDNQSVEHFLTEEKIHDMLTVSIDQDFSIEYTRLAIRKLADAAIVDVVDDAYADKMIMTSDAVIKQFFVSKSGTRDIYDRSWSLGMSWLMSAFKNQQFWEALSNDVASVPQSTEAPSSEGFVTFDHNQEQTKSIIAAVEVANEAVRANNEIDDTEKSWLQSHLAAGLVLVTRGGKILKDALISTVIKPLQSSLKYVVEEKGKLLISAAIKFLMGLFS